jgi:hypothetical protein
MTPPLQQPAPATAVGTLTAPPVKPAASGGGSFFSDLLEIVNPLQHLPIISTLYRAITGDKIGSFEQIAGDTLFGGLYGAVSSFVNLAVKDLTGEDIGAHVLAFAENLTGLHLSGPSARQPTALAVLDTGNARNVRPLAAAALAPGASLAALNLTSPAPVRVAAPVPRAPLAPPPQVTGAAALLAALSSKSIPQTLALRALAAYQKSLQLKS